MKKIALFVACIIFCMQDSYSQIGSDSISHDQHLNEVVITASQLNFRNKVQSLEIITSDANYLSLNRGSSLMNSLEKIPGIKSMQIGQGFSKPMIRGLGFNRVAVLQNGIKQQGQQWGADHGLEIDQYDVENVDIYKGASSLQFGSDAIAGVIAINPYKLKDKDGLSGEVQLNGATNNRLFGNTLGLGYQQNGKYIKGRFTYQNFEDYRVPATSFTYVGWNYPIHNKILKNTAGREMNFSVQGGIIKDKFKSNLLISNVYAKTGFFAGAHGVPTEVNLEDDGKHRNIGLPYQRVNHLKVVYNQEIQLDSKQNISFDLGYQHNDRKEYSVPHSHGTAKIPDTDLELALKLQTATANASWANQFSDQNKLTVGLNIEYQDNNISGFSFLLPQFEQMTAGVYAIDRLRLSEKLVVTAGIRYDYGHIRIHGFTDQYLPEEYQQRAEKLKKDMGSVSFSAGASYIVNPTWSMKFNIARSFRMPTANELSSNGVHHGTFRHELGDKNLKAETSYQLDYSIEFSKKLQGFVNQVQINTSLFGNYFPNFIFLNPSGEFSWLPDAGQYYKYEQAKALRAGGEFQVKVDFANMFRWETALDYVYAKDLDSKYPIPFTPPFSLINELSFHKEKIAFLQNNSISVTHRFTADQNRVNRNELSTKGSHLFDIGITTEIPIKKTNIKLIVQAQNVLNKKYYNHLSFYRYLDIPEIGRNFRFAIQIPIGFN